VPDRHRIQFGVGRYRSFPTVFTSDWSTQIKITVESREAAVSSGYLARFGGVQ
jgi:hypothetical protein